MTRDEPQREPDLLEGERECDSPGCDGIAHGELWPWSAFCGSCVAGMSHCEREGCIDTVTDFEDFAEYGDNLRPWPEARLFLAECPDCKSTKSWPMRGNPGRETFMKARM